MLFRKWRERRRLRKRSPGWNWALDGSAPPPPPLPPPPPGGPPEFQMTGKVMLGFEDGTYAGVPEGDRLEAEFVKAADRMVSGYR